MVVFLVAASTPKDLPPLPVRGRTVARETGRRDDSLARAETLGISYPVEEVSTLVQGQD